ncbi:hypothetical protein BMS3Abin05_01146 [bacterium BMS3Abin05]|nr:hypothetical protein BMS3Abin05_01146 [bacterium BMS3Abin05]
MNSANAPGCVMPIVPISSQRLNFPALQKEHFPQASTGLDVTRSPFLNFRASFPTSATVPENSCPITIPGSYRPVENPCTSEPQMPATATRISTSSASIFGNGTSVTSTSPISFKTAAFIVFTFPSSFHPAILTIFPANMY